MITLFQTENKEYFIDANSNTYFVMDDAGQCRLATQSRVKARNIMNSILYCTGMVERVELSDLIIK